MSDRFVLADQRTVRYALVDGEEQLISCSLCPEAGGRIRIPIVVEVEALPCRRPTNNGISCSLCRHLSDEPLDRLMGELDPTSIGPVAPPPIPVANPSVLVRPSPPPGKASDGF